MGKGSLGTKVGVTAEFRNSSHGPLVKCNINCSWPSGKQHALLTRV